MYTCDISTPEDGLARAAINTRNSSEAAPLLVAASLNSGQTALITVLLAIGVAADFMMRRGALLCMRQPYRGSLMR